MISWSSLCFSGVTLSFILILNLRKVQNRQRARSPPKLDDMSEFLDWIEDIPASPVSRETKKTSNTPEGDTALIRGLAAVGLAATAPRDARNIRSKSPQAVEHPASGNDELADDVVRVTRVSEEEEAERYFSAFSFYKD